MFTGPYPTHGLALTETPTATERHILTLWRSKWVPVVLGHFCINDCTFWKPADIILFTYCPILISRKAIYLMFELSTPLLFKKKKKKGFSNWVCVLFVKGIFVTGILKTAPYVTSCVLSVSLCHPNLLPHRILPLRFHVRSGAKFFWGTKSGTLCWSTQWWRGGTPASCRSGIQRTITFSENSVTASWHLTASLLSSTTTLKLAEDTSCSEGNI